MSEEKRLFVGLPVASGLGENFFETLKKLKMGADKKKVEVKWVPESNLHITLRFLGATPEENIEDIKAGLQQVLRKCPGFSFKIQGLGAFPDDQHARVLWAGVQNKVSLRDLQHKVDEVVLGLGFLPDERDFSPHLTLGRIRKSRSVKDMFSPFVRKKFGTVVASQVVLYESCLGDYVPRYTPLATFDLSDPIEAEISVGAEQVIEND